MRCVIHRPGSGTLAAEQPVIFASRSLTSTEQNYCQLEKELLAVVFAQQRFDQYGYGRAVIVESDHQPLETISKKPLRDVPCRIQRVMLELQRYDVTITYKRGTTLVLADTLSRAYLPETEEDPTLAERVFHTNTGQEIELVKAESEVVGISDGRLQEIAEHTAAGSSLQQLKCVITHGWPDRSSSVQECVKPNFNVRYELVTNNGIIFKGSYCVVPSSLRPKILERIHAAHVGVEESLRRACESVYWPGMNAAIKDFIEKCDIRGSWKTHRQRREPLHQHGRPTRHWAKVGIDLFSLEGRPSKFLITADYWSNYFELEELKKTDATAVIRFLRRQFATHGIPDEVISDNGPPFQSQQFEAFARKWMFRHRTTSPYHSQANGLVESAVKTAKSLLRTAIKAGEDPWLAILTYRNTPTQGMDTSPVQRLMSRRTKTLLPMDEKHLEPAVIVSTDSVQLQQRLHKQRAHYDQSHGTKELPELNSGDIVRVRPMLRVGRGHSWWRSTVSPDLIMLEHGLGY